MDGEDDHIHLLVNYPPKYSVSSLVNSLKGVSSRRLRQEFPDLDLTVRVWDVLSGRLLVARELDSPVQSLAFSPDGKYLFCGNGNTTCYEVEFKKLLED